MVTVIHPGSDVHDCHEQCTIITRLVPLDVVTIKKEKRRLSLPQERFIYAQFFVPHADNRAVATT